MLSRLNVEEVTQAESLKAVQLLHDAGGLPGHKYAIDALVAAMALRSPAAVLVLTPDRDDWSRLCGDQVKIKDADSPALIGPCPGAALNRLPSWIPQRRPC